MSDQLLSNHSSQHLKSWGPLGVGTGDTTIRQGPCGIDDNRTSCQNLSVNLFAMLLKSPEFAEIFDALKGTGVKIVSSSKLSINPLGRREHGAGSYNPITGIIELPTEVYTSAHDNKIKSTKILELIAHEIHHAWWFRKLYQFSSGGSDEARAKILAQSIKKMGREKFIESTLHLEKAAEIFAVKVVLEIFKNGHSGFRIYQEEISPDITIGSYHSFHINSWWIANESLYREDAEIEWVRWMYRLSEGDYKAEIDKDALKKWLHHNPDIR